MKAALALSLVCVACAAACAPAKVPREVVAPPRASSAVPPAAPTPRAPDEARELASKIDPIFADYTKPGSPGCAVGVYRAGEILFARGYGLANLEHDLPIEKGTAFDIASVSKQFTAAAILLLVEDKKLSLDDDVRKYVPELPRYGKAITLRHLLHHTSGLRDYAGLLSLSGFDDADLTNDDDGLFAITHQKALNFPTGTEWSYSNSGYFLLSIVVKRAAGKALSAFAKERIFDPLGMTSTFILDDHTRIVARRATAYAPREDGAGFGIAMSNFEQAGDGAVQTTIEDLARWDANFYDPKVGGPSMLATLRTPGKLDDGKPVSYAMGLEETTTNGVAREEHNGAWAGYRADLVRFPTERLSVACLCNVANADAPALADAVATALLPKLAESTAPRTSETAVPKSRAPSPAELAPLVGAYYNPVTFDVRTLSLENGVLMLGLTRRAGGPRRALEALDARTFVVKGGTTRYVFVPAAGKAPAQLVRTPPDDKPATLVRFESMTLSPTALAEYAGRYSSEEIVHDMQLGIVDGKLRAGPWGRTLGAPPLDPIVRDAFSTDGVTFHFDRDARGHIRGFVMSADRMRGIRWVRR